MLAILSSAKTLDYETPLPSKLKHHQPLFEKECKQLVKHLQGHSVLGLQKLLGVSKKLAQLNYDRYQGFRSAETRPAIFAYKGDAFRSLELEKYSMRNLKYAQEHILFVSGLYGLLRPLDLMKPYRLEMNTQRVATGHKTLYGFWGEKLSTYVDSVEKGKNACLINLASKEYSSVVCTGALETPVIHVEFKEKKGEKLQTVAIFAKQARGAMVNYMILEEVKKPQDLKDFQWEGYRFQSKLSDNEKFVFTR